MTHLAKYHTELIDHQEIQKPLPKRLHAIVQARLIFFLMQWGGPLQTQVLSEQNVLCGADRLVPDIAVVSTEAPDYGGDLKALDVLLAIEIASPGQKYNQLVAKCDRLHKGGARLCWIVLPAERQAFMYWREEVPVEVEVLRIYNGRAGDCTITTADLFAGLERYEETL
jgi:Uma2 family endonuclease